MKKVARKYRGAVIALSVIMATVGAHAAQKKIRCNQIGFFPSSHKYGIAVGATSDRFYVINTATGDTGFGGVLGTAKLWTASDEQARVADFSPVASPGTYLLRAEGCDDSYPFTIAADVHDSIARGALKAFYYNRSSFELTEKFAGAYARAAGHPDTAVEVHPSAASSSRAAGSTISSPGGWYDAGDYGKYIVNSGISTYTIFAAYEAFPDYYDTLNLDIPESSNNLPDILDEALYNFRWMLTMQDTVDGGVYHKLTSANFCGMVMPDEDKLKRYVVAKSTAATLDFAAVCAQASRIFGAFETTLPGFSDSCLTAARMAWKWARANPDSIYSSAKISSPKVSTGEYGDGNVADEFVWAATELYIATEEDSFYTIAFPEPTLKGLNSLPSWPTVGTLALYSLALCNKKLDKITSEQIVAQLTTFAESSSSVAGSNPYKIAASTKDFGWGSNSSIANRGMVLLVAYKVTGDSLYLAAAIDQLDYLLGRNPLEFSYVTGYGDRTPMFIHHRPSAGDGIAGPVPGFLAGGPNPSLQDTSGCNYYTSKLPAMAYLDSTCSYASNEIAINWNAPLAFLAGGVAAAMRNTETAVVTGRGAKILPTVSFGNDLHGALRILALPDNEAVVTVYSLMGKVLARKTCARHSVLPATWPMQVVCVKVTPVVSSLKKWPHASAMILSGVR